MMGRIWVREKNDEKSLSDVGNIHEWNEYE